MANNLAQNISTAARQRDRRQKMLNEGTISPREAAMSAYSGPSWDAFFGSFNDQADAGNNVRVNWSGFGDGGSMARRGGGTLADFSGVNPLEAQALKEAELSQLASARSDIAKREMADQKGYTDALQAGTLASLSQDYDRHLVGQAFAMPEERSITEVTPAQRPGDAKSVSVRSAEPNTVEAERMKILRRLPPTERGAQMEAFAKADAQAQMAQAATTKAEAELRKSEGGDGPKLWVMRDGKPLRISESDYRHGDTPASTREQGRPVTSGDAGRIADLDTSLDDLGVLRSTLTETKDATGTSAAIGAGLPSWATDLTGWGTDAKKRQGVIDRVKQVIGKALEGGVLRKEDEIKYEKILPTIKDPAEVAESKLDGLEKALIQRRQTTLDSLLDAGYETSKFQARPPRNTGGGAVPMVAPDGRQLMVPADRVSAMEAAGAKRR